VTALSYSTLLLDIEGTTSSIAFVHDVLFPFAKRELPGFLKEHFEDAELAPLWEAVARDVGAANLDILANREGVPPIDAVERTAERLMDADAKATGLKELQGKIWRRGFESGELKAHVYVDVPPALKRWKDAGMGVYIYSSGSVAAQQLFFGHTTFGNLRPFLSGHFDTTTGPKKEPESYRKIATSIAKSPDSILFLSDIVAELDAARSAGLQTGLMLRHGNDPVNGDHGHWMFESFEGVDG
jgi:enolase-phosphatase E1